MQIRKRIKTVTPTNPFEESLEQELLSYAAEASQILNNGLKFKDNFNAEQPSVADSGNADTEFAVAHTLKRVPEGYVVTKIDKAGVVYDSGTAWTATNIYLKCNVANCAIELLVF